VKKILTLVESNAYFSAKELTQMLRCPNCNSKDIGKIGSHQFYCWGCFIELTIVGNKMSVYQVEEDGSLSSLDDIFFDEDAKNPVPLNS
jgi:hypothetical protein